MRSYYITKRANGYYRIRLIDQKTGLITCDRNTHQGQVCCRVYCRGVDGRKSKTLEPGITASAFIQAKITEFRKRFIQSVKILWLKLAFFVYCIDLSSGLLTRTFNVIE